MAKEVIIYKDYLSGFCKNELIKFLDLFDIKYKKSDKKSKVIEIILDNLSLIVDSSLSWFQMDEFYNIKLIVKKKGNITIRFNHLLKDFLKKLEAHKLLVSRKENQYIMPKELLNIYSRRIQNKKILSKIKENTSEYNLILGFIDAYGVVEFDKFYEEYSKKHKLLKDEALKRINKLSLFYGEFKVFSDNKKAYIASNEFTNVTQTKKILKKPIDRAIYTIEELINIHNFNSLAKCKSYKKLFKFINRNYYVERSNYKIINRYVLLPYFTKRQTSKEDASKLLSELIDEFFEFSKKKYKDKFIELIEEVALDYPSWNLKGNTEKDCI